MEQAAVISFFLFVFCLIYWIHDDDDNFFNVIIGIISFLVFIFSTASLNKKDKEIDTLTIQEIDYAVNKCSSFGGLREFRGDVIICMDKTEIKMNFEPEKKVEAE